MPCQAFFRFSSDNFYGVTRLLPQSYPTRGNILFVDFSTIIDTNIYMLPLLPLNTYNIHAREIFIFPYFIYLYIYVISK